MYWLERYKKEISKNVIPLYCVMGNEIFINDFNEEPELVYKYCIEHHTTWEKVLKFKFNPNVKY